VAASNADGTGGTIVADGESVDIGGTARLLAAATAPGDAGGSVLVGVSAPGGGDEAESTTVADGATIIAAGKGSEAGGHIETSGQALTLGAADVSAGPGGTWVLDPTDLTIGTAAATAIDTALNGGSNVTEETTDTGATDGSGVGTTASAPGNINIDASITWSTSATLTLSGYNSVNVNAAITATGDGTLDISAETRRRHRQGRAASRLPAGMDPGAEPPAVPQRPAWPKPCNTLRRGGKRSPSIRTDFQGLAVWRSRPSSRNRAEASQRLTMSSMALVS
jgi:hypothetical protein